MTIAERASRRLVGLHIIQPADSPHQTARNLLAMQGQDWPGVLWSLGLRVPGSTESDIEAAFNRRELVRSWPLRGTLQVCAAEDLHWMLEHFAPKIIEGSKSRQHNLELDDAAFELSRSTIRHALEGGKIMKRDEILAELDRVGLLTAKSRSYHLLWRAALEGVVCQGPVVDGEQAFVMLDEWIAPPPRKTREEALAELALRYFASHGPALLTDFTGWAGITAGDAKIGIAANTARIEKLTLDGKTWWFEPAAAAGGMAATSHVALASQEPRASTAGHHVAANVSVAADAVFLLPGFDEFVLGYKNRDDVLEPAFAERICPGGNGVFFPTVVSRGRVVGTWKRTIKKKHVDIQATPFDAFSSTELDGIAEAAERYGEFLGMECLVR